VQTRSVGWLALAVVMALAAPAAGRADFGDRTSPWFATVEAGGSLAIGEVHPYVDGRRVRRDESSDLHSGVFDLRGSLTRSFGRWLALSGQLGWTNWQSDYREHAGYGRSDYVSLSAAPELRLPLGRCARCPALYLGPRAGFVVSHLDLSAPRAAVDEDGSFGWGGLVGGRGGIQLSFHRRLAFGMRLETGVEMAWLRHQVTLSGAGQERQLFVMGRTSTSIGFWWNL
jgi:hypothetical protein